MFFLTFHGHCVGRIFTFLSRKHLKEHHRLMEHIGDSRRYLHLDVRNEDAVGMKRAAWVSTLRIQVCCKKGIIPTFLFFSDGIGTLNPHSIGRGMDSQTPNLRRYLED